MKHLSKLVGTRSTASHFLAKISGTRWNASLPRPLRKLCRLVGFSALLWALAGGAALFLTSCSRDNASAAGAKEEQLYTCGMHPQVIEHKPGNCPICGMKLTPVRKQAGTKAPAAERKIKYYKSTMNPGEVSPTPRKDSMGMDMVDL